MSRIAKKHVSRKRVSAVSVRSPKKDTTLHTLVQDQLRDDQPLPIKKKVVHVSGDKSFYIITAVVVVLFIALILTVTMLKKSSPVTLDDYHDLNLQGKLDPEEGYLYNGFSFVKVKDTWYTRLKRQNSSQVYHVEVRYGPRDVESVPLHGDYNYLLTFNSTFITFDPIGKDFPHVALAAADLSTNLVKVFNLTPYAACTKNETKACTDRPIVGCTQGVPVIFLKEDPTPAVTVTGTCITVQGTGFDLVKAANRLLLAWYEVM